MSACPGVDRLFTVSGRQKKDISCSERIYIGYIDKSGEREGEKCIVCKKEGFALQDGCGQVWKLHAK